MAHCWSSTAFQKEVHFPHYALSLSHRRLQKQIAALFLNVLRLLSVHSDTTLHSFPVFILLHPKNVYCFVQSQKKQVLDKESFLCILQDFSKQSRVIKELSYSASYFAAVLFAESQQFWNTLTCRIVRWGINRALSRDASNLCLLDVWCFNAPQ